MMNLKHNKIFVTLILVAISLCGTVVFSSEVVKAQNRIVHYAASDLVSRSEISVTPPEGTFQEGSTFEVPIFLNTLKNNINAVDLRIKFTPDTLSVVRPSGGKSIIGLWVEPPTYDNTIGTVKIVGAIPGGITSDSGLVVIVTFKAKAAGQGIVEIRDSSQVLLNDGAGTPTVMQSNRGVYTILPQPPGSVVVYSNTHPFQESWYNNPNPVLAWNKDPGVSGFSYILDTRPNTIPPNEVNGTSTSIGYQDLRDGLAYFHIKSKKDGVWGATTDYTMRIDTTPPADFRPTIDYLSASVANRFLISFFTTDGLSGVDHYEVGIIDGGAALTESPVFVETESPYQLPYIIGQNARVIVRAFDRAGNLTDATLDASVPFLPVQLFYDHTTLVLSVLLIILIIGIIIHYFFGHHIYRRLGRAVQFLKRDDVE